MTAIELIAAERNRQISVEGWTPDHDSEHEEREMARAAQCYLEHYVGRQWVFADDPKDYRGEPADRDWPWAKKWWKPKSPKQDLVRAAALIAAEIDRLQRAEELASSLHSG